MVRAARSLFAAVAMNAVRRVSTDRHVSSSPSPRAHRAPGPAEPRPSMPGRLHPPRIWSVGASRTIRPSSRWIWRWARSATRGSWVTTITVRPLWWRRPKRPMIAAPVAESRLPVGSSASRMAGSVTSARAIATRCCSPPESWFGRWPARSDKPDGLERGQRLAAAVVVAPIGERQRDVVHGRGPGEQVPLLEDEADEAVADLGQGVVAELRDVDARRARSARGRRRRGSRGCS